MNKRTRSFLLWMYALLAALLVVILLRMFVCTTCIMPSGEILFINKWSYGLRSPLPSYFGYHRWLPQPVQKGDLAAFDNPMEDAPPEFRQLYVCRCIAPAGDSIQVSGTPFRIPRKGNRIAVTAGNKHILHEAIKQHEGRQALIGTEGTLYIDGSPATHYTFTRNYCWMENDKDSTVLDSRYFGLVPEELLIGKVFYSMPNPLQSITTLFKK